MRLNKPKLHRDTMEVLLVGSNSTLGSGIRLLVDKVAFPVKAHVHSSPPGSTASSGSSSGDGGSQVPPISFN